jgi:hypothetical protein
MDTPKFSQWCILEIFGHVRLAGLVSEQTIAGQGFVRVDVPENDRQPAFSRLYGASAIYSISPVTEEVARAYSARCAAAPLDTWDARAMVAKLQKPDTTPHDPDGNGRPEYDPDDE